MEAYLDNSATTRCYGEVRDIVVKTMMEDYGNPSAMHKKGVEAENYLKAAKEILSKLLKVKPQEILFTSGGTESNNLAIIGGAMANRRAGTHVITTAVEHAAVGAPVSFLEEQGFEVTVLPVNAQGVISLEDLEQALREDTILVSIMYVNNEIGSVQPIEAAGRLIHAKAPRALFHVDAIQAFGKYRIYPKKWGIDALSVSAHKIHGPKGVGFLYINEKVKIQPLILGGGQQGGMRSGTDNVPGIAGVGAAAEKIYDGLEDKVSHMYEIKERLAEGLRKLDDVVLNGMPVKEGAPHILSASFLGVRSEVMLHSLEDRGIYVSAGSACSSHKRQGSSTLTAIGLPDKQRETTLRFSFCEETTAEEIDYCLENIKELLPMLRRYTRH
ncbi:MAG: cysteine desulfurase family protein [Blautia sp.]